MRSLQFPLAALCAAGALLGMLATSDVTMAEADMKPDILVIMGDDIGWFNPSCYHGASGPPETAEIRTKPPGRAPLGY